MLKWSKVFCQNQKCLSLVCIVKFGSDNILQLKAQLLSYQFETNFIKSYTTTKDSRIFKTLFQCDKCNCHALILTVEFPLIKRNENETSLIFLHDLNLFKRT